VQEKIREIEHKERCSILKIAVISDIHGNLPALEAVMSDIKKRKADKIICLGDIVGKGPSSKEAIDICKKECDIVIKGNWEDFICKDYTALNQGKTDKISERIAWYINSIGDQRMKYLEALPHSTEFYFSGKLTRLFHAHPKNYNRYYQNSSLEQRLELFDFSDFSEEEKTADIAIYADIHSAYLQAGQGRYLVNVGSVGNPLETTQASYVILEGENDDPNFSVQFMRIAYDIEKAIELAKEANVPDLEGYISELRTAVYFKRSK